MTPGNGHGPVEPSRRFGIPRIDIQLLLDRMRAAAAAVWAVLMIVASRCNWTTGKGGHPGLDSICSETGVDRRSVQRALVSLQERLVIVVAKRGGGRGWAATYDIHPDLMKRKGGSNDTLSTGEKAGDVPPFSHGKGGNSDTKGGENGRKGGSTPAPSLPTSFPTTLPGGGTAPPSSSAAPGTPDQTAPARLLDSLLALARDAKVSAASPRQLREMLDSWVEQRGYAHVEAVLRNPASRGEDILDLKRMDARKVAAPAKIRENQPAEKRPGHAEQEQRRAELNAEGDRADKLLAAMEHAVLEQWTRDATSEAMAKRVPPSAMKLAVKNALRLRVMQEGAPR